MAEGLRLLGGCPRCGGELEFRDADATAPLSEFRAETVVALAPHMVMGMPRR
jgi:hypothetical protein